MDWDEYFLEIAKVAALRSKDPSTKVGAVVVKENKILSMGFNGFPVGVKEPEERWQRPEKYSYVCHAELNALIFAGYPRTEGSTLYCTHKPCENCAKYIIQFGVKTILIPKQQEIKDPGSSVGKMETHARAEAMFAEVGIRLIEI